MTIDQEWLIWILIGVWLFGFAGIVAAVPGSVYSYRQWKGRHAERIAEHTQAEIEGPAHEDVSIEPHGDILQSIESIKKEES